jgi:putative DNA primase/helicase
VPKPDANPFLAPAMASATNVASAVEFLVTKAITQSDPAACYDKEFVKAIAAHTEGQHYELERVKIRLANHYGREFNKIVWGKIHREVRTELLKVGPTSVLLDTNGGTRPCLANAIILFREHLSIGYDEFTRRVTFLQPSPWGTTGAWSDRDDIQGTDWLQHKGCQVKTNISNEAAQSVAWENPFHPIRDSLTSLEWDGEPRLDTWLVDLLGVPDTQYARLVGARWPIQAIARIMQPGCKAESVMVLEGPEGKFKSTALRALANGHTDTNSGVQWFSDSLPAIDHDEIATFLQGVWIFEIAELEAIRGKAWTHTRKFFSIQRDRYRAKYGRNIQDANRQCVFAASTNEAKWGGDPAGLRRFWPLRPNKIRIDALLKVRDQLWAEALFRYSSDEIWWFPEDQAEIARSEQAQRYEQDSWQIGIAVWLAHEEEKLMWDGTTTVDAVLAGACGKPRSYQDKTDSFRIANIMRRLGWEGVPGEHGEVWRRKGREGPAEG